MKRLLKRTFLSAAAPKRAWLAGAAAVMALLAGCGVTPDRYYTLSEPMGAVTPSVVLAGITPLYVELAPIALPERLARPQLLVRRQASGASAQVDVLEQHRWTSSFENELRDALASGIASRLGAVDVTKGGKPASQPVWRIAVQLRQFDAVENSRVDADMLWAVKRSDAERVVTCQWKASEPVASASGIDALAQAAQRIVARAAAATARDVAVLQADSAAVAVCQR